MLSNKYMTAIITVALFFCLGLPFTAFGAEKCKNVNITLKNSTNDTIKVIAFKYYDFDEDKWRTENMFGVDGHQKINRGKSWTKKRNLAHILKDDTRFLTLYRRQIGGNTWEGNNWGEGVMTGYTDVFECRSGMSVTVEMTQ